MGMILNIKGVEVLLDSDFTINNNIDIRGNYAIITVNRKHILLHRIVMCVVNDRSKIVDHINGNTFDNRKCNLRIVNRNQNVWNRSKQNSKTTSKYKGVSYRKDISKWHSRIKFNYKLIHLGHFKNEVDAALAYNNKATELFGEYAKLNIIE